MQHYSFQAGQPFREASQWHEGPRGRDETCKPLADLKKTSSFQVIKPKWERTAAEYLLKLYEHCILNWAISRAKDQRSFETEISGERIGPSLFNLGPRGLLLGKARRLRKLATQANLERFSRVRQGAARFRARYRGVDGSNVEGAGNPSVSGTIETAERRRGTIRGPATRDPAESPYDDNKISGGAPLRSGRRRPEDEPTGGSSGVDNAGRGGAGVKGPLRETRPPNRDGPGLARTLRRVSERASRPRSASALDGDHAASAPGPMVDTEVGFENTHPLAEGGPQSGFPRDSIPQEATARSPNFEDNFEELEAPRRDAIGDISGFFDDSTAESSPARTDYDSEAAGA